MSTIPAGAANSAGGPGDSPADVLSAVLGHAERCPNHSAVKDLDRELSYADLASELGQVAAGLMSLGVGDGSRVALLLGNSVDFVVAALACNWVGAMFVPVSISDPAERQVEIVSDCDPSLVITARGSSCAPESYRNVLFGEIARDGRNLPCP